MCMSAGYESVFERNDISAYPKAPVPVVIMSTGTSDDLEKLSRIFCRLPRGEFPLIV